MGGNAPSRPNAQESSRGTPADQNLVSQVNLYVQELHSAADAKNGNPDAVYSAQIDFMMKVTNVVEKVGQLYEETYTELPKHLRQEGRTIIEEFQELCEQSREVAIQCRQIYKNHWLAGQCLKKAWTIAKERPLVEDSEQVRNLQKGALNSEELRNLQEVALNSEQVRNLQEAALNFFKDEPDPKSTSDSMSKVAKKCQALSTRAAKFADDLPDSADRGAGSCVCFKYIALAAMAIASAAGIMAGVITWPVCAAWSCAAAFVFGGLGYGFYSMEAKPCSPEILREASKLFATFQCMGRTLGKQRKAGYDLKVLLAYIAQDKEDFNKRVSLQGNIDDIFKSEGTGKDVDAFLERLETVLSKTDEFQTHMLGSVHALCECVGEAGDRNERIDLRHAVKQHAQSAQLLDLMEAETATAGSGSSCGSEDFEDLKFEPVETTGKCYVPGTLLQTTPSDYKTVECLKIGQTVLSSQGVKLLVAEKDKIDRQVQDLVSLKTSQSGKLDVSADHLVVVPSELPWKAGDATGTRPANQLKLRDHVICGCRAQPLTKVSNYTREVELIRIRFDPDHAVQTSAVCPHGILTKGAPRSWHMMDRPPFNFVPKGCEDSMQTSALMRTRSEERIPPPAAA